MKNIDQADVIKVAAVLTAIPRWTGALLEAEGVPIPVYWLGWWRITAAVLSAGMAVTEAFAISYVLNAWRNQHSKGTWGLGVMALAALLIFTLVLAPYIAANVHGIPLAGVLGSGVLWWVWSIAVASSTGIVVGAVGYAQRAKAAPQGTRTSGASENENAQPALYECASCGLMFRKQQELAAHIRYNHKNGHSKPVQEPVVGATDNDATEAH